MKRCLVFAVVMGVLGCVSFSSVGVAEEVELAYSGIDEVTVTATRLERATKDVPEAISVIDKDRIDNSRMFNISDALSGTPGVSISSKSGGYDARLLIRGGGLKANYGIREIFLMRDGVPITDPDSFTRLDFIDTQDIERIEISKGPGNIYATGSTAGVIHLISKSIFEQSLNTVSIAGGDNGKANVHARISGTHGQHAYAVSGSLRKDNNDWRENNEFESRQLSVKYGYQINDSDEMEFELSYTDVDLNLPGEMNSDQFNDFKRTGRQRDNNGFFKTRGRYSETWFFNSRYISLLTENIEFKPRFYYTHWRQNHPVTPFIVENGGVDIMGTDLEILMEQEVGSLVAGITYRVDRDDDAKRYQYRDLQTNYDAVLDPGEGTLNQNKGSLAKSQDTKNQVAGIFAQQSFDFIDRWIIDLSMRYDAINISQESQTFSEFNFPYGTVFGPPSMPRSAYGAVDEQNDLDKDFSLHTMRMGVSYKINSELSAYANVASGEQVPFSNELESNQELKSATNESMEIGLKGRSDTWGFDLACFSMSITDEIIAGLDEDDQSYFQNAGETEKMGVEVASDFQIAQIAGGDFWGGINYVYSDFSFVEFTEYYTDKGVPTSIVNDGHLLPYVPKHYYSVHVIYKQENGLSVRLQSDTWSEYYVDNANTEKYAGYEWLTNLNVNYKFLEQHSVALNIQNISDKRYASIVEKNAGSNISYTAGSPRSWLLSYRYQF